MTNARPDDTSAVVVGAGVAGLTSAVRLLEAGVHVTVLARERTPHTTSDVGAAVYYPHDVAPRERVVEWGRESLGTFARLARDAETGVRFTDVLELWPRRAPDPWWREMVPAYRRATRRELPAAYGDGLVMRVPVVDMPTFMRWLEARVLDLGGRVEEETVRDLGALAERARLVVNCSGLGARALAGDETVRAVRGQVALVENPGITRAFIDAVSERAPAYVIPRLDGVLVGGTAEADAWDTEPDPAVEREIMMKVRDIEPALVDGAVIARAAGLRPARPAVRLELERKDGMHVIHNYGHGGAGVTLSWGCARDVAVLAREAAIAGRAAPARTPPCRPKARAKGTPRAEGF